MSYYRTQLEAWLKEISVKTDRVLDIGGAANPVPKRLKSFESNEYMIFDNGIEEPKMEYIKFDICEPLTQLEGFRPQDLEKFQYNAVFCLEVFEYVWHPVRAVQNIYDLMSEDSVAYISFPAIYPVHNPVEHDMLRYTKGAIEKYLKMAGFSRWDIIPRVATEGRHLLAQFYNIERMHPVKGSPLPYDIGYLVTARKA